MAKTTAVQGPVLDSAQATAATNDGAVYDAASKKWTFTTRQWK